MLPYLRVVTWATAAIFFGVAVLVAIAFPLHASDALTFGEWSRLIAQHWHHVLDPSTRPLFYVLQGSLWHVAGYSDTSGRLLCGLFSLILVVSLAWLVGAYRWGSVATALVVLFVLVTPVFAYQVVSSLTDLVVAALITLTAALVVRLPRGGWWPPVAVAAAAALAVLAKPSAILALVGVGAATLLEDEPLRTRVTRGVVPVGVGTLGGLVYYIVQARHTHSGLFSYVGAGVNGPYYAHLAAMTRREATLDLGWLGPSLRTLLLFTLLYTAVRLAGARHTRAVYWTVPASAFLAWFLPWIGAREASFGVGAFTNASSAVAWAITVATLCGAAWAPADSIPSRRRLLQFSAYTLLPLAAWIRYATYDPRLLTPAWPGLFALLAVCAVPALAAMTRFPRLALAPVAALVVAVALNVYNLDGLGRAQWSEWSRTPASKRFDRQTTRAIVLPDLTKALVAATPQMGSDGRMLSPEGEFRFFFPGRVDQSYPTSCAQLSPYRVFVLTLDAGTRDYMQNFLHVSADPNYWAACSQPKVRFLTTGAAGYAVFAVGS